MSSITPEERCKVAARLRQYADGFDFGDANPIWYVMKAVFGDVRKRRYGELFACLADLIEPMYEHDLKWLAWVGALKNGDAVDRFAYDLIEHGGDMGPNGNTWNGIDEGMVLTSQLFDKFRADFKKEIEADSKEEK